MSRGVGVLMSKYEWGGVESVVAYHERERLCPEGVGVREIAHVHYGHVWTAKRRGIHCFSCEGAPSCSKRTALVRSANNLTQPYIGEGPASRRHAIYICVCVYRVSRFRT